MLPAIKSELLKIATTRSTYIITAICLLLSTFLSFYVSGYRLNSNVVDPNFLANEATGSIVILGLLIVIVGILQVTHEYRYNTIMYTLASSGSRTQAFFAKLVAITCFAVALTLLVSVLAPLAAYLGLQLKGLSMIGQEFSLIDVIGRGIFYGWAYAMYAAIIAFIVRNQVGTIAAVFILPVTVEPLLMLFLKENAMYLPFTALRAVLDTGAAQGMGNAMALSPDRAILIVLSYLAVGSAIALALFHRRDAN